MVLLAVMTVLGAANFVVLSWDRTVFVVRMESRRFIIVLRTVLKLLGCWCSGSGFRAGSICV